MADGRPSGYVCAPNAAYRCIVDLRDQLIAEQAFILNRRHPGRKISLSCAHASSPRCESAWHEGESTEQVAPSGKCALPSRSERLTLKASS